EEDYLRLRDSFVLTPDRLVQAKKDLIVMHPLPRVVEIHPAVDDDPRAVYFQQARLGMFVRMALVTYLLGVRPC
ncbi:aspartate carbamoyltransferase, partial [Candidatus Bipolaricaulota bacterium]|nr:aspartate carbamoyltransferase [Candidatus Bipolaricaulota bacterium]